MSRVSKGISKDFLKHQEADIKYIFVSWSNIWSPFYFLINTLWILTFFQINHVMRNKDFQSYETKRIQQKI